MEIIKHSYRSALKDITGSHHKFTSFLSLGIMIFSIFVVQRLVQTPQFIGSRAAETPVHYEQLPEARGGKLRLRSTPPKGEITAYIVALNTTYDENTEIIVDENVLLEVQEDITLTINGNIDASSAQIFSGSGSIAGNIKNDQIIPQWFGILPVDPSDLTTKMDDGFKRMRTYLRQDDGRTVFFSPGMYQHKFPYWLKGVRNIHILGYGARFRNVMDQTGEPPFNSRAVNDWVLSLDLNPDYFHDMPDDYLALNNFRNHELYGNLIQTVNKGATSVNLIEPYDLAEYDVGDHVLVHGFNQQPQSYPPNLRYYEINKIAQINGNTITLENPLKNDYLDSWYEDTDFYLRFIGKPRIITLNRSLYNISEHVILEGIELLDNPHFNSLRPYDNNEYYYHHVERANIVGALRVDMINCKAHSLAIGQIEEFNVDGCVIDGLDSGISIENDKIGGTATYTNTTIHGGYGGGSGFENVIVKDSIINDAGRTIGTASKYTLFENNILNLASNQGFVFPSPEVVRNQVIFRGNTITIDDDSKWFFNPGYKRSFTVKEVLSGTEVTTEFGDDTSRFLILGLTAWTLDGKIAHIKQRSEYVNGVYKVTADFDTPPVVGDQYFFTTNTELVWEGNTFLNRNIDIVRQNRGYPIPFVTIDGITNNSTFTFTDLKDDQTINVLGNIESIEVNVVKPYGGLVRYGMLVEHLDKRRPDDYGFIDLTQEGTRIIGTSSSSGALGIDDLKQTNNDFTEGLQFRLTKWSGWTEENLPIVEVKVNYTSPFN